MKKLQNTKLVWKGDSTEWKLSKFSKDIVHSDPYNVCVLTGYPEEQRLKENGKLIIQAIPMMDMLDELHGFVKNLAEGEPVDTLLANHYEHKIAKLLSNIAEKEE